MVDLQRHGYMASRNAGSRRRALVKALRAGRNSYRDVYRALTNVLRRDGVASWKKKVVRRDRDWLRDRARDRGKRVTRRRG